MTDLSAIEVELLYAIKNDQGRTLTYYGDELRKHHSQLTRALERLKQAGYVQATENNRLSISDEFKKRQQERQQAEAALAPVVETKPDPVPVVESVPETSNETLDGTAMKVTPEMIAEYMADGVPRTAAVIAQNFGLAKGTSLINPLRKLVTDGMLSKNLTVYSLLNETVETVVEAVAEIAQEIAEPVAEETESESDDDLAARLIQVLEKAVPETLVEYHNKTLAEDHEAALAHAEKIRNLPTLFSDDLRARMLNYRGAFTSDSLYAEISEKHFIDKDRFLEIFEDVASSGVLMGWDGTEFIDPTLEYVPGSMYIAHRTTDPSDAIAIMDEYCENLSEPYRLFDIVETTRIHHSDVTRYLVDFDYDVSNPDSIVKGPHTSNVQYAQKTAVSASPKAGTFPPKTFPVKTGYQGKEYKPFKPKSDRDVPLISYAMIESLNPKEITDFLDGGVKVSVFIRKFNLHPDDEKHIVEVLTLTNVAELTSVEGVDWLFLKNRGEPSHKLSELEITSLTAPTGSPARAWTPVEKENLRDALKIVAQEENRVTTAKDLDPTLPDTMPSNTEILMQAANAALEEIAEASTIKIDKLRDAILESTLTPETVFMSRELADELGVPVTECICEHRTFGNELHEDNCPVAELENGLLCEQVEITTGPEGISGPCGPNEDGPTGRTGVPGYYAMGMCHKVFCKVHRPNAQWSLTLKMLEERLRFEHQGSAADQLNEIRKYLEP
jgi:DNA-binding MarR family transcriptional regulator